MAASLSWRDGTAADVTIRVLESDVSTASPVSDAGLGAAAITIQALMGYMGAPNAGERSPNGHVFGFLVITLGIAHVILVILQPVAVGTWCRSASRPSRRW